MEPANQLPGVSNLKFIADKLLKALENYPIYGIQKGININASITPTKYHRNHTNNKSVLFLMHNRKELGCMY